MKFILLWLAVIAVGGILSVGALTNVVNLDIYGFGIFDYEAFCFNNNDGQGVMCDVTPKGSDQNTLAHYENPDVAIDDFENIDFGSLEGCSPDYWASTNDLDELQWPIGYPQDEDFSSPAFFNTIISISSGSNPTLHEALQSEGDGINKLARHSVAALLNSAHEEINYPITIVDIIAYTQAGIDNQDYSFADVLESNNNLGKDTLCERVE